MPHAVPARPRASRLFLGGAFALLVALGLCIAGASGYARSTRWVEHSLQVQQELDRWTATLVEMQNGARAYMATGERNFVAAQPSSLALARDQARRVELLVSDNPRQAEAVEQGRRAAEQLLEYLERQVARMDAGGRDEAVRRLAAGEGQVLLELFTQASAQVNVEEQRLLVERRERVRQQAWLTLAGAGLVAVVAFALLVYAWQREVRHEGHVADLARAARLRLKMLGELGAALSSARTPAEVAEVVVDQGLAAASGDTCTLYVLDPDASTLKLVGQRGVAPDLLDRLREITESSGNPAFTALREGRSLWAENHAAYASFYPELTSAKVTGKRARAFWSVPLQAEGRSLGLLGVGFYEPRSFSQDERAFVATLAHQCAQALLRASRREAEDEARSWFSTTLRSIGDAVIATNQQGAVTFVNPVAERLTGFSEAEALGQPLDRVFRIIAEATRAPVESPVSKVLREGKIVGLANHTLLLPKSGPELPIDDSGAPIRNEAGDMVGVVLVFRDVSREKRQESRNAFLAQAGEVLVSSLDYQTTLGAVARLAVPQLADWCAVHLVEPETERIRQVAVAHVDPEKARYAEQLGERYPAPPDAATGVPAVIRSGKSELYPAIPLALLEAGARSPEHLRALRELELRSAMIVPLRGRRGTLGALTFVYAGSKRTYTHEDLAFAEELAGRAAMAIENSSALKEADDAHQRERWLRQDAERTNRLKDEFLATVSHELRTPLNAILGWTLTLRRGSIDVASDRALAIVERNARAQARLIEDVLDVSRIVSGKLTLSLGPTSVAAAARAAIETVTPAAEAKGITISAELPSEPTTVTADANRLQQVIWNLLSNSVKFTPKDGRVLLRVYRDGSDACVTVKDSGEGIRPELLRAIFEPFQQADSSTTRRHGGLGLGLSIVKQLVAAHGGAVSAESDGPGQGSTFRVRLPVRALAASSAVEAKSRPTPGAGSEPLLDVDGVRLDGLRVLVVDDEADARMLVREILSAQGAIVELASSAAEARALLQSAGAHAADVIVSDIGMPDEDGYSFMRQVRQAGAKVPAVALTAYASDQDAERALLAGFQHHIIKPVEPAKLIGVVARLSQQTAQRSV